GDRNGWSITKYLRVPWTYNHKPEYDRPLIELIAAGTDKPQSKRPRRFSVREVSHAADLRVDPSRYDPRKVLQKYRGQLRPRVRWLIRVGESMRTTGQSASSQSLRGCTRPGRRPTRSLRSYGTTRISSTSTANDLIGSMLKSRASFRN